MPDRLHYKGDVLASLAEQAENNHVFGPDMHGAHYVFTGGEYDPETNVTTAEFKPYIDPRTRERFHGGADEHLEATPVLEGRDVVHKH